MSEMTRRDWVRSGLLLGFGSLAAPGGLIARQLRTTESNASAGGVDMIAALAMTDQSGDWQYMGGFEDVNVAPDEFAGQALEWEQMMPQSFFERDQTNSVEKQTPATWTLDGSLSNDRTRFELNRLLVQHPQLRQGIFVVPFNSSALVDIVAKPYQFEATVNGIGYQLVGTIGRHRDLDGIARDPVLRQQSRVGVQGIRRNFFDTGQFSIWPGWKMRCHGPELHELRPCRNEPTWHFNLTFWKNGQQVSNSHLGAYTMGTRLCMVYWDNVRIICKKPPCTPSVPTYSEVRNFVHEAIDSTFRALGIALPYFVVAGAAVVIAGAFYPGLVLAL
jgi:hypothetical protein